MKSMKKTVSAAMAALLLLGLLASCGTAPAQRGGLRVVTTIFPIYDWCREILGGQGGAAELTMLLDSGVDLHSYQPTAADMVKIASCDVFLYVGGESDEWVEDALRAAGREVRAVSLLEALGGAVREEELVEGMEAEHGREEPEEGEAHGEEEGPEYDEHVWLSLRCASSLTAVLADAFAEADPAHAAEYRKNAADYAARLNALDKAYAEAVAAGTKKTLLFADRFPFRYLADDYGLSYYAAFSGCSAETEASFETIVFLAGKADELGLSRILQIESADGSVARTVIENTRAKDQTVLVLDSLQSVTAEDVRSGTTYLGVMESNLNVLREAVQ